MLTSIVLTVVMNHAKNILNFTQSVNDFKIVCHCSEFYFSVFCYTGPTMKYMYNSKLSIYRIFNFVTNALFHGHDILHGAMIETKY